MKIVKKQTTFEMNGGVVVEQQAWTAHGETCITGGFRPQISRETEVGGSPWLDFGIDFGDDEVAKLSVYMAAGSTRAGIDANRGKQVNMLQFSGNFFPTTITPSLTNWA